MDPLATRQLGQTDVRVTQLGLGGASIGSLGRWVPEEDALATVRQGWDEGLRLFDTAPWYGRGLSELRMGAGLRDAPRDGYVLSTKVGRWLRSPVDHATFDPAPWVGGKFEVVFDYTYDGIMRSYEQSLQRLGVETYDLAVIHDLDFAYHRNEPAVAAYEAQLLGSGWRALDELRRSGLIKAHRCRDQREGHAATLARTHGPRLLPRRPALHAARPGRPRRRVPGPRGARIGVIIGAVFASGILATGPVEGATYAYGPASQEIKGKTARIAAVCERHGVPLAAAALQFPLGHPQSRRSSPGRSAAHVHATWRRSAGHPGRPVGRAQARGPAPPRGARPRMTPFVVETAADPPRLRSGDGPAHLAPPSSGATDRADRHAATRPDGRIGYLDDGRVFRSVDDRGVKATDVRLPMTPRPAGRWRPSSWSSEVSRSTRP